MAQPNPATQKTVAQNWARLILTYARHKRLFVLRAEDADAPEDSAWAEILRNPRINRQFFLLRGLSTRIGMLIPDSGTVGRMRASHVAAVLGDMVAANQATYDPPGQTQAVLLYWRTPEEWAQVLHEWVRPPPLSLRAPI